jgi:hypothetical protein
MYDETLISQLSELRAAVAASNFMLLSLLEKTGCDPESLLKAVDVLMTNTANAYENEMRKANGLEPRERPRTTTLSKFNREIMDSVEWSTLKEQ